MDIKSLLVGEQPGRSVSQPPISPQKPLRQPQKLPKSPLATVSTPSDPPARVSPVTRVSHGSSATGGTRTPPSIDRKLSSGMDVKPSGTPLDSLADIASIQQHEPAHRATSIAAARAASYEPVGTPSTLNPAVHPIGTTARRQTPAFDIPMSEPPRETIRTDYSNTSLSPESQALASQLAIEIKQNRHAYEARIRFVRLLHQGFVDHIYPSSSPESRGDPHKYDVLKDLRTAREELDHMFAVGEDLWAEWIQDESLLARSIEERIAVIELCQRSVEEEYGSTKLWIIYGDWMLYLFNAANAPVQPGDGGGGPAQWSEEDRIIGREAFKWESVMEVWRNGADATKWHINDSHMVWNRYLDLLLSDLAKAPSRENILKVRAVFDGRLRTPHSAWDQTFQLFSTFISTYEKPDYERYERIMGETTANAKEAKDACRTREQREMALQAAAESGNKTAEFYAFAEYLDWEMSRRKRGGGGVFNAFDLTTGLYQRAVLRFPADANLWEDYMTFLIDASIHGRITRPIIPALERATRHCPWSGSLWSQRLLTAETIGYSFHEISAIKHKATSSGLLDAAGMDEVLKVHTTWCSYLRRHAFQADGTDENLDVAEVGIRSAIESIQELGAKEHKEVPNDPMFRLERIYIRYLSESGSWDSARETFKSLIPRHGHSYEFWLMYHAWELICWAKFTQSDGSAAASRRSSSPSLATAVLKQALRRTDLDWPEKIMESYIVHCEHYEDAEELQVATVEIRKAMKALAKRREKQQSQAQAQAQVNQVAPTAATAAVAAPVAPEETADNEHLGKRKREEPDVNGLAIKKVRSDEMETEEPAPKRDREHATVSVKNLPKEITQVRVRQFFRDCGKINTVKLLPGDTPTSTSALVEFESHGDAVAAQTRDQKPIDGQPISVELLTQATLWVTNFPSTADEGYIRDLFTPYGSIIEVRFPSLQFNTHRRFCYVQFTSPSSAHAATELDGKELGGKLKLVVKISDPARRQNRSGPVEEGREIHVSNLDWKVSEAELAELFGKFGTVQVARIPTKANGGSRGFGFVVFDTKASATAALEMDSQPFRNRSLHVHISTPTGAKRISTTIISRVDRSNSPTSSMLDAEPNGSTVTDSSTSATSASASADRAARTLALMNIPDTINDARIRALTEPYGPLVKIVLRPDHQGAIVEFRSVADAGKAALGLEGFEIVPGRKVSMGSVSQMLKTGAEKKVDKIEVGKPKTDKGKGKEEKDSAGTGGGAAMIQPSAPIRRPAQPGTGRRGGLGSKKGGMK